MQHVSLPTSSDLLLPSYATPPLNLTTHQETWKGVWLRNDSELSIVSLGIYSLQEMQSVGWRNAQLLLWVRPVPGFSWGQKP